MFLLKPLRLHRCMNQTNASSAVAKGLKAEPCYLFSPLTSRVNENFIIKSCLMQYCSGKCIFEKTHQFVYSR